MTDSVNPIDLPAMPVAGARIPPGYDAQLWRSVRQLTASGGGAGSDFSGLGGADTLPFNLQRYGDTRVVIGAHRSKPWYPHFDSICAIDVNAGASDVIPLDGADIIDITESCLVVYEVTGSAGEWDVLPTTIPSMTQYTPNMVLVGRVVFSGGKILYVSSFPHKSVEWVLVFTGATPTGTGAATATATATGTGTQAATGTGTGTNAPTPTPGEGCPTFGAWQANTLQHDDYAWHVDEALVAPYSVSGTMPLVTVHKTWFADYDPRQDDLYYHMRRYVTVGGTGYIKVCWEHDATDDLSGSSVWVYLMDAADGYVGGVGQETGYIYGNSGALSGCVYLGCQDYVDDQVVWKPCSFQVGEYVRITVRNGAFLNEGQTRNLRITSVELIDCGGVDFGCAWR